MFNEHGLNRKSREQPSGLKEYNYDLNDGYSGDEAERRVHSDDASSGCSSDRAHFTHNNPSVGARNMASPNDSPRQMQHRYDVDDVDGGGE